ncbi:glycoside hydrolase family 16 protein [Dysgonomonas sp. HGC4]|uniref:glycoside hydrolase family 16 protein n=1 Tax=Dysgonomonas sp. HGC4 TaxID=1658009 RepID=UPI00068329FD|nr:glycoside hydrolase family 16 protein [Dysgonomonas sp. HGC4]MBD8346469.1 glycoside hydrolase family 16 protein [Dysgonomonas sp. HGC4]
MKKSLLIFSVLACILFSTTYCTAPKKEGWQLVWEENFDGTTLDTSRWSRIPRGTADWQNYMSFSDSCYEMKDGNLVLKGIVNNDLQSDTVPFLTGGVWTKDKVSFKNGRIEIRAKLGEATGAWPAIWMLSQNEGWPMGGEIDIMEHLNFDSIVYQTIHTHYTYDLEIKDNPVNGGTNLLNRNDYNIYALEINADSLVFFVNDSRTFAYPRIETDKEGQYPFDDDFFLLIDMQLGGSWVGGVDPKDLPVDMKIDWVRFYQKQ